MVYVAGVSTDSQTTLRLPKAEPKFGKYIAFAEKTPVRNVNQMLDLVGQEGSDQIIDSISVDGSDTAFVAFVGKPASGKIANSGNVKMVGLYGKDKDTDQTLINKLKAKSPISGDEFVQRVSQRKVKKQKFTTDRNLLDILVDAAELEREERHYRDLPNSEILVNRNKALGLATGKEKDLVRLCYEQYPGSSTNWDIQQKLHNAFIGAVQPVAT